MISYLTLPSTLAQFSTSDYPNMLPGDNLEYLHTAIVDVNSLILTNDHKRRFARARRFLGLEVSVHPSQLTEKLVAFSSSYNFPREYKSRYYGEFRNMPQDELDSLKNKLKGKFDDQ